MNTQKFRWSKVYESAENELIEFLEHRKLTGERISEEAFAEVANIQFPRTITIWCAEGSMTVRVEAKSISIQPGDALRIGERTPFTVIAGISGCIYYQTSQD